jgi:Skp family chaperone for outer membrane proteins
MGKGSRNRQERIDDKAVNPQKYVQKKKTASKNYTSLITVIVTLVVAFTLIFSMVSSSGILLRTRNTISSDNFKVTGTMMSYYAHTVYSGYVNQYQEMYGSLLSQNSGYSVYTLMGIDPDKSLKDQMFNETTGETWFDYFMTQAREQTEQLLLYCEGAKAAGIELDEEDMAEIDSSISLLAAYASYYGYSTKAYIRSLYGKGVNERDVRNAMKLSTLATKFTTKLAEDFESAATAEDVEKFYNENVNDYLSADYLSYTFSAELAATAESATEDDIKTARADYEAAKKAADEAAAKLVAAKTEEEFRETLEAYLSETMAADYSYEKYLTSAEGETDEEKEANAKATAQEKLDAAIAKVAKAGGYAAVFDAMAFVYSDAAQVVNINAAVKKELGITDAPAQ